MNNENLIPFSERTESEQREIRSKGGKASGRVRSAKAIAKKLANTQVKDDEILNLLQLFGIEESDFKTVMIFMQMLKATKQGDTPAFNTVMSLLGEDVQHEILELKKKELKLKEKALSPTDNQSKEEPMLYKALTEGEENDV